MAMNKKCKFCGNGFRTSNPRKVFCCSAHKYKWYRRYGKKAKAKTMAKPKMTDEQKELLAAKKSFDADVERAKAITCTADYVLRELCKSCKNVKACKKLKSMPMINCRMSAIMGVSIGMIQEERKATLETTWELLHGQMAALKAEQKGGAK